MSRHLSQSPQCAEVGLLALGTHPTLTLEAVTMLRDFAFGAAVKVRRMLGITYKCAVFPDVCGDGEESLEDPLASLIGRFESPPPYERYTFQVISETVSVIAAQLLASLRIDTLVCTSPFVVCALMQKLLDKPMLGYLGLPLLWKRPTDHFDNATARAEFWELLQHLLQSPQVVLATNNPVLTEQIAFQAPRALLPVVRPHARFTNAVYTPTKPLEAMLVSRTKFLWVTLDCALQRFMDEQYPIKFNVANSDSKLSFQEMASHRAVVLLPWEHALMAFFEFYSMAIPLLLPSRDWALRLVFDAEGNLGATTSIYWDVSPGCDRQLGCDVSVRHPHPPFAFAPLESRKYWYQYTSFAQFPHIHRFDSIPHLLQELLSVDAATTSASMRAFNDETLVRSVGFWRSAGWRLGLPSCRSDLDAF
ncbi:alkbh5, partial [Symbiodinium natans]